MPLPDYENIQAYKSWCSETEMEEVWKYCTECDEDYLVLEGEKICPICDKFLGE